MNQHNLNDHAWQHFYEEVAENLAYKYTLSRGIAKEIFEKILNNHDREREEGSTNFIKSIKKDCLHLGKEYFWNKYFPDVSIELNPHDKIDAHKINSVFKYTFEKRYMKKINKKAKEGQSQDVMTENEIITFFIKHCKELLPWLTDHPEQEFIDRLKSKNENAWNQLSNEFVSYIKDRFSADICNLALAKLYKNMLDPDFNFYSSIRVYLYGIAFNISRNFDSQDVEFSEEIVTPPHNDAREVTFLNHEEGEDRISKLAAILCSYYLKTLREKGSRLDRERLDILTSKYSNKDGKKGWKDLEVILGDKANNLRQRAHHFKSTLRNRLEPKIKGLFGEVAFRYEENKNKNISIFISRFNKESAKCFFESIRFFVFDHLQIIGEKKSKKNTEAPNLIKVALKEKELKQIKKNQIPDSPKSFWLLNMKELKLKFLSSIYLAIKECGKEAKRFSVTAIDSSNQEIDLS